MLLKAENMSSLHFKFSVLIPDYFPYLFRKLRVTDKKMMFQYPSYCKVSVISLEFFLSSFGLPQIQSQE